VYLYPMKDPSTGDILNSDNIKVHPRMKDLYKFFKKNGKVKDIEDYDENNLNIFSRKILQKIADNEPGWEKMLPEGIADIIKERNLFKNIKV
ncbi:MAG: TonB-dependent receptor, partial [Flavobacteriaceae bacterium]